MFAAHDELTDIDSAILPPVLAIPIRFAVVVFSLVNITIGEGVSALSVFQAHEPVSIVFISVHPRVHSVPMDLVVQPLTYI